MNTENDMLNLQNILLGDYMSLQPLTIQLINDLHTLKDQFYQEEIEEDQHAFFHSVKEKTDIIFETLHAWEEACLAYVKETKSTVHFKQIIATKENIELLIVHSFYKDMRKRRYMEYYQSSLYVLQQLEKELIHD